MKKDPQWYYGFFGFFALMALPGLLEGEWGQAVWLVWVVWFLFFFTKGPEDDPDNSTAAESDDDAAPRQ